MLPGKPKWDGGKCYTVGSRRETTPLQVSVDCVEGSDAPNTVNAGELITFRIRLNNNTSKTLEGISLGFRIYSETRPDMSWTATTGWVSPEIDAAFDYVNMMPHEAPGTEGGLTGDWADTIGFVPWENSIAPGLEPDFNVVSLYVQIGPIDETYENEYICIDSSWFRPEHEWLWDCEGDTDDIVYPTLHEKLQKYKIVVP